VKPTLSQVCTLNSSFETDVEDYSAGGCRSMEAWFTKLEDYLQRHSMDALRDLLTSHEMRMEVASFQGGLFTGQSDARELAWELFNKRLRLCRELSINTMVVAFDVLAPITQHDVERARELLSQAARSAGNQHVRLALEPQARAVFGNNLQTISAVVADVGSPHLGICLDLFQFYLGPSKFSDLAYLSKDNLFHVQLSDLADVPREFATDSDRIVPGDGDFDVPSIVSFLTDLDYQGCVSMELMNPQIWQVPARQFSEIAIGAMRKLLGQESLR
jgi:sugar phosphate isomerase/epimerase